MGLGFDLWFAVADFGVWGLALSESDFRFLYRVLGLDFFVTTSIFDCFRPQFHPKSNISFEIHAKFKKYILSTFQNNYIRFGVAGSTSVAIVD